MSSQWKEVVQGNRQKKFSRCIESEKEREECTNVEEMDRCGLSGKVTGGDMHVWKQIGDQCWCRLARLLGSFKQRRKSWVKGSADEAKVLRQMQHLVCVVRNMSAVCCSGKGLRWNVTC